MKVLDYRSDTTTLPTKEMLESILTAQLGDDNRNRGDPTVKKLEEIAAKKLGKEDAILTPTGTMGNSIAILSHTERTNQVILEINNHTYTNEYGSWMLFGGLTPRTIVGKLGYMDPQDITSAIRKSFPKTGLICNENTFNNVGGIALSPNQLKTTWEVAKEHDLPVHLDGARLFNATIYHGEDVKAFTKYADSVMICLSKGLSAPVGSLVCGTEEFIATLRNLRKMHGGGMRQAGIIAAPGIIALTKMVDRLREDHDNAKILANGLKEIKGIELLHPIHTNLIFSDFGGLRMELKQFVDELKKLGIVTRIRGGSIIRWVTHRGINKEDIEYTLQCIKKLASN